jgi:hypothetical protein
MYGFFEADSFTYTAFESAASTNSATGAARCDPHWGPVEARDYIQGRRAVNHHFLRVWQVVAGALRKGPKRPTFIAWPW